MRFRCFLILSLVVFPVPQLKIVPQSLAPEANTSQQKTLQLDTYPQIIAYILSERTKPRSESLYVTYAVSLDNGKTLTVQVPAAIIYANPPMLWSKIAAWMAVNPWLRSFLQRPETLEAAYQEVERIHHLIHPQRAPRPLVLNYGAGRTKVIPPPQKTIIEPGLIFQDLVTREETPRILSEIAGTITEQTRKIHRVLGLGDPTGAMASEWRRLLGDSLTHYAVLYLDPRASNWASRQLERKNIQFKNSSLLGLPPKESPYDLICAKDLLESLNRTAPNKIDAILFDYFLRINQLLSPGGLFVLAEDAAADSAREIKLAEIVPLFHLQLLSSHAAAGLMRPSGYHVYLFQKTASVTPEFDPKTKTRVVRNSDLGNELRLSPGGILRIVPMETPLPPLRLRFVPGTDMFGALRQSWRAANRLQQSL